MKRKRINMLSYSQYKILGKVRNVRGIRSIFTADSMERRIDTGKNGWPEKTFYVIRRNTMFLEPVGLMADLRFVIGHLLYAEKKGYIPVVDMQSIANAYLEEDLVGKENSWEYYFEQPGGYNVEDVLNAKNVIISTFDGKEPENFYTQEVYDVVNKYIRFSKNIEEKVEKEMQKIQNALFEGQKILGINR